jgi:hypothetical protein
LIQFAAFTDALESVLGGYMGRWGVILDSPGGDLASALKLGTMFRTAGWDTVVGLNYSIAGQWRTARCTSACVYTFAGGPARLILKDNALAVHQFSEGARLLSVAQVQYLTAQIAVYLTTMGVSPNLQTVAGLTLPSGLTPLTIHDALALGVATHP